MAIFEYVATDPTGNSVDGTFEATDEQDARNILAQYNLTPSKLSLQGAAPTANNPTMDLKGTGAETKDTSASSKKQAKTKSKKKKRSPVFLIFK